MSLDIDPGLLKPVVTKKAKKEAEKAAKNQNVSSATHRMTERHFMRRASSEQMLNETLDWHFEDGNSYHTISQGDIDSLTFLRAVVKQQKIDYMLISTWCMAVTDAEEVHSWLERGLVKRVDFYVGEIFQGSYAPVYEYIKKNCIVDGARLAIFRNHSKIMAGFGERFDFAIESSANVNTNPRAEQTTICVDRGLARFYKDWFDGIKAFNRDFDDWYPWEVKNG